MKISKLLQAILLFSVVLCAMMLAAPVSVSAQSSAEIEIEASDLKQFRKIIAENVSLKKENSILQTQADDWKSQAMKYKKLAADETFRADEIQGKRIRSLEDVIVEKDLQVNALRNQAASDRDYISRLEFDKQKLKSRATANFWKGMALGGSAGSVAGSISGYQYGKNQSPKKFNF